MPINKAITFDDAGYVGFSPEDTPDPSFLDTLGAAVRQENTVGSTIANPRLDYEVRKLNAIDPVYDPFKDLKGYEDQAHLFEEVYNETAATALKRKIDQERKDRATLAQSGWTGTALTFGAGVIDLPTLLPGGALVRGGRIGYNALKSAAAVGAAAGLSTAVQEGVLQGNQELRTPEESAFAIGGSVILGGILGAGVSKLFTKGEWNRVAASLEDDLTGEVANPEAVVDQIVKRAQSAGAASVDEFAPTLEEMGVGGPRAAQIVANATAAARISPGIRTMLSPSAKVREIYLKMVDNPIHTAMGMEGKTFGADVENLVKIYNRGAYGQWKRLADQEYISYRKTFGQNAITARLQATGEMMTKSQFMEAVARAGRRNDIDVNGNEFVTKTAQAARERVFDPLLKRAIDAKLLPEDVKTTTAASYVTRLWNRSRLIGEEDRFRQIARDYFQGQLDNAIYRQDEAKLGKKIVHTLYVDDKYQDAFNRLNSIDERLAQRGRIREGRLSRIKAEEARRFDVLSGRAPKEVVEALRVGADNDTLVKFAKETRKADNVRRAKSPVLNMLKTRGGVRIGSPLAAELANVGVTPRTVPGLFKKEGGRGAADNIVARESNLFDTFKTDENGYLHQDDIIEAVRNEMAGAPTRSPAEEAEIANVEAMAANLESWLETAGLSKNSTIKEIRERMADVLGQERLLDDADMRIARLNDELEEFDRVTDKLTNDRLVSDSEASKIAEELRTLEDEINASAEIAKTSPRIAIMVDYAKARREFGKARYDQVKTQNRIDALKRLDADGKLNRDLELELMKLEKELPEIKARIAKAEAKSEKLKPMVPKQADEIPEFVSDADRADYVEQVITEVFNNLTGKGKGDVPEWIVPIKKGPLKERTFNIPDELVEDFLDNDMEMILRRYSRSMAADIELTEKFGRADMKDQFAEITYDYVELRKQATTPAERLKLDKAEEKDVKHMTAFRDMLRGTYQAADRLSGWSAITNTALTWNYMRLLGGVTVSSLTDASRVPAVHGLTATMREALPILTSRLNGIRSIQIARRDVEDLGAVAETVMQSRLASMADLRDPYRYGSRYERFLDNAANIFTKFTGIGWWTDTMNMISAVMTENRVLRNVLDWNGMDKYEKAYMGFLGIDEDMAQRIAAQFKKHGMEEKGIKAANVSEWDDDLAYRALGAALNKDTDRTIIKPGMGDIPLWMKTNTGRIVTQFKSFGMASHQRVLIAGLQERPRRLAEAMVLGTTIGMMVSYLKMIERGDFEKADDLLSNPGKWIGDGFDRTGILFLPFEITNTADKVSAQFGGPNISIASGLSRLAGDRDHSGSVTRYASRDPLGAVLGPTAGLFSDLAAIYTAMLKGERTKGATNAALRQIPGGTLPGARTILNSVVRPAVE
jgi:hypothetical protein